MKTFLQFLIETHSPDEIKRLAHEVKIKKQNRGKYREYVHPKSGGTLTVNQQKDGTGYVGDINVPKEHRKKGIGQALYFRALHDSSLMNVGEATRAATRTRNKLVKKGLALHQIKTKNGQQFRRLQLHPDHRQKF